MARTGKASCPVCGQDFVDPDFTSHRSRAAVLTCPNCKTGLVWVKPLWERGSFQVLFFFAMGIPDLVRFLGGVPHHDSPLRRAYLIFVEAALLIGAATLLGTVLEGIGVLPPKLKAVSVPSEQILSDSQRVKELRSQSARLPKLQINPQSTPPSLLRGKSILFPSDSILP